MGEIVIVLDRNCIPDGINNDLWRYQRDVLGYYGRDLVENRLTYWLSEGRRTAIGNEISSAIRNHNRNILIIPTAGGGSYFHPGTETVVFDFHTSGFIAGATAARISFTVMLWHELGHAKQWIMDNAWFRQNSRPESFIDGYNPVIEKDNLVRHEWPMSNEFGEKRRHNYTDLFPTQEKAEEHFKSVQAPITVQKMVRGYLARKKFAELKSKSN